MSHKTNLINDPIRLPQIFPSVLGADMTKILEECRDAMACGADGLHIDVMDGHFVPNLTMGPRIVQLLRKHMPDVYLDVHLMVDHPEKFVGPFAEAGANNITYHIEPTAGREQYNEIDLLHMIHGHDCQAGICLNPQTEPEMIEHLLSEIDLVLVMSVHPGFGGQSFIPDVLEKTKWIKQRIADRVRLQMDGGINKETAGQAYVAGVDNVVAGSAFFGAKDRKDFVNQLREQTV